MSFQLMLDIYGYRAMFSPELIVFLLLIGTAYFLVMGPWRTRLGIQTSLTTKNKVFFIFGLLMAYAGFGGPLNLLGHFQFTIHMFQQSILYMIMPPLIYFGLPEGFLRQVMDQSSRLAKSVGLFIRRPIIPIILFNAFFSVYHMPIIFDSVMTNIFYHHGFHLLLVLLSFFSWWSVLELISVWNPMSGLKKMGYILLNSILLTPACALIIFAGAPLFKIYTEGALELCLPFYSMSLDTPQMFHVMTPLHDQQLGGIVMKLIQEISYGVAMFYTFRRWYQQENSEDFNEVQDFTPKYS